MFGPAPDRSPAIAAMRRSSWRWCASAGRQASGAISTSPATSWRTGPAAALFRCRGRGPGCGPQAVPPQDIRVQPVPRPGARTEEGDRACRARDVPLFRHGRRRDGVRRRQPHRGSRRAVGGPHRQTDVCDRRHRAGRQQRGLHRLLRSAQRIPPMRKPAQPSDSPCGPAACSAEDRTDSMPTSWSSRSTTARCPACPSTDEVLLRQSSGKPRRAITAGPGTVAPAAAQHRADRRLDRQLHVRRLGDEIAVHSTAKAPPAAGGTTPSPYPGDRLSHGTDA